MKNMLSKVVEEFKVRMFDESFSRIRKCLNEIDEPDLWHAPNSHVTSIGSGVQHIIGNSRQWVISTLGDFPDERKRSEEFTEANRSKGELLDKLMQLENELRRVIDQLNEQALNKIFTVQNFEVSGFSILVHVIEHTSYHTGQISLLTKLYLNKDLGYYAGNDLE